MLGVSILRNANATDNARGSGVPRLLCNISMMIHMIPSPNNMAMNGGRCVMVLKTGTKIKMQKPRMKAKYLSNAGRIFRLSSIAAG